MFFKHLQMKVRLDRLFYTITFTMPALVLLFGVVHTQTIIGLSIILFAYGMTVGFSPPLFSTIISNTFSEHRGTALGLFNFIRYAGMAVDVLSRRLGQKYFYPIKTEHDWCK